MKSFEEILNEEMQAFDEELKQQLEEEFAPALNFYNRMISRGSEIGDEGNHIISQARQNLRVLFFELSRNIYKLAEQDIQSKEHKGGLSRKGMQYADEVAKIALDRLFDELKKR